MDHSISDAGGENGVLAAPDFLDEYGIGDQLKPSHTDIRARREYFKKKDGGGRGDNLVVFKRPRVVRLAGDKTAVFG